MPQNHLNKNKMTKTLRTKNKKPRQRFKDVDVWKSTFGPIAVNAIYDVYSQRFNVELHNIKNYSFSHCVEALRKLENPNYESSGQGSSY